jgi:hypothetical protein
MSVETGNIAVVREYIAAIERFDVEAVGRLLHPNVVQIERPNKLYAKGQTRGHAEMTRDLPRGAKVLRKQSYPDARRCDGGAYLHGHHAEGWSDHPAGELRLLRGFLRRGMKSGLRCRAGRSRRG